MKIRILKSLDRKVDDLIERYNRYIPRDGEPMCWNFFLMDAVETILEKDFTDWDQIQHLIWLYKSNVIKHIDFISSIQLYEITNRIRDKKTLLKTML